MCIYKCNLLARDALIKVGDTKYVQGVLGLHEFWAREKLVQAKFVLVKLCTSSFVKLRASEILSTCYPRNGLHLKIRASEIRTSEIRASQGPSVLHNIIGNPTVFY